MAAPVKMRGRIKNGIAEIKSLMPHPMETGTRRNADGELVAAHYIQTVTCFKNDEQIMQAHWGPAVSKNPFFSFKVKNAAAGDVIRVNWLDNTGDTSSGELVLK